VDAPGLTHGLARGDRDATGVHTYLQLVAQYAPAQLERLTLDQFKAAFHAYTADDTVLRGLGLGLSAAKKEDKPALAQKLAPMIMGAAKIARYTYFAS
jgi:hypothetical protein